MSNKRIEYIKKRFTNISEEHLDLISSIDITENKLYLVWLARIYSNGEFFYKNNINENAITAAKQLLETFHELKNKLPENKKDINSFKSLFELSTCLFFIEKDRKVEEESFLKNGAAKVFENEKWLIVKPFTMESAIKFGKDTTWCTSSKERLTNHFYNYYGKGELFIIIDKTKKDTRTPTSKFQLYFRYRDCGGSSECRNSNNSSIDELLFFKNNPEIFKAISVYDSFNWRLESLPKYFSLLKNPTKEQILSAIKSDFRMINHIKESEVDEEVQVSYLQHFLNNVDDSKNFSYYFKFLKNPTEKAKEIAINIKPSIIKYLEEELGGVSDELKMVALNKRPNVIKYIKEPTTKMISIALEVKPDLIVKIKNPTKSEQLKVVKKLPNLLRKIENPNKEAIIEALKIGTVKLFNDYKNNLTKDEVELVVKEQIRLFRFVEEPSEELQKIAIKDNYDNIKLIKNPSKSVKTLATRIKNKEIADLKKFREQQDIKWGRKSDYLNYYSYDDYSSYSGLY